MKGIDILNKTMIMDMTHWAHTAVIICLAIMLISLSLFILFVALDYFEIANICFLVLILSAFTFLLFLIIDPETETGRYRYEVTVDDSVSFVDLLEKYEVIEQNGRIWTLEDKED